MPAVEAMPTVVSSPTIRMFLEALEEKERLVEREERNLRRVAMNREENHSIEERNRRPEKMKRIGIL